MDRQQRKAQWQDRLPDVDHKLLDKVLRLQDSERSGPLQALRGSVQPDPRRTVERWLKGASETERQVALQFFGSLAGGRLVGLEGEEQSARLKDILAALQNPAGRQVVECHLSPRGEACSASSASARIQGRHLKYIHFLDDETRRQRWMYTTWHHLPNYRNTDSVANSSSHYVLPHRPQHRHYVIHPDWPPN